MALTKISFLSAVLMGTVLTVVPCVCHADISGKFYTDNNQDCYVDTDGSDTYWLCGAQPKSCNGNPAWSMNTVNWLYHGDHFNHTKNGGQGNYWCCGGTHEKAGKFVAKKDWIDRYETVTETFANGTCKWKRAWNVCGQVDEKKSETKCTQPDTASCATGYVARNGKCVQECKDGYIFENKTSDKCVLCETTERQAIVQGECKKCEPNQILDKKDLQCKTIAELNAQRLQISSDAHDTCWLCVTPKALLACMQLISNGGKLTDSTAQNIQKACSIDSTSDDDIAIKQYKTSSTFADTGNSGSNENSSNTSNSNTSGETTSGSSNNSSNTGSSSGGSSGKSGGGSGGGKKFEEKQFTLQEEKLL